MTGACNMSVSHCRLSSEVNRTHQPFKADFSGAGEKWRVSWEENNLFLTDGLLIQPAHLFMTRASKSSAGPAAPRWQVLAHLHPVRHGHLGQHLEQRQQPVTQAIQIRCQGVQHCGQPRHNGLQRTVVPLSTGQHTSSQVVHPSESDTEMHAVHDSLKTTLPAELASTAESPEEVCPP